MGAISCTGPGKQLLTWVPGAGAHHSAARPAAAACLPALAAGRGLTRFPAPAGRMPLCQARAPRGLEVGIWGRKRKGLCKLTLYDNCPGREDRSVTTWSLCTHLVCLAFPSALHALLLRSAALSPGLSCSSFSIYPGPHQTGSSCVF